MRLANSLRLLRCLTLALALVSLSLTSNRALGQFQALQEGQAALDKGHRLEAVRLVQAAAAQHPELQSMAYQYLPVISDYSTNVPFNEAPSPKPINEDYVDRLSDSLSQLKRTQAIQAIVELAQKHQIVILNEAHDTPRHRAVAMKIARALAREGFEYLAIEALFLPGGKSGVVELDFARLDTGFYTKEPVFGDFVRQAARSGYQLVAYEIEPEQRKQLDPTDHHSSVIIRENAQAENLVKVVLAENPDARIFVYVGYSHATEDWKTLDDGREVGWLAAQLKRKTGIDPLTIDQVAGTYNIKTGQVDAVYQLLHNQQAFKEPTVVKDGDGNWITSDQYHGKVDMTLFLPLQRDRYGRPDWLACNGYRIPVEIRNADHFRESKILLQAFVEDEPNDAIPMDQVVIQSAQGKSTLLLPPGTYRLVAQGQDGTTSESGPLIVKPSSRD